MKRDVGSVDCLDGLCRVSNGPLCCCLDILRSASNGLHCEQGQCTNHSITSGPFKCAETVACVTSTTYQCSVPEDLDVAQKLITIT